MSEKELLSVTGLSESAIVPMRLSRLEKDVDWFRDEKTRGVHYSARGLEKIKEALGVVEIAAPVPLEAPDVIQEAPAPKKEAAATTMNLCLTVERICPNPTWIMARLDGLLVQVRVQNNRRLSPGKKLQDCMMKNGVWVYPGRCW